MDYFALDGYYRLSRIGILPLAVVNFKRSVPQVVVITGMGALLAYLFSDLIATHVMGFESTAMLGGMMVVLQLCSSFPQFSGNQVCRDHARVYAPIDQPVTPRKATRQDRTFCLQSPVSRPLLLWPR